MRMRPTVGRSTPDSVHCAANARVASVATSDRLTLALAFFLLPKVLA